MYQLNHGPLSAYNSSAPVHWKEYYPTCQGNRQSPIDVPYRDSVMFDAQLANLTFINYDQNITGEILNNGHTGEVINEPRLEKPGYALCEQQRYRSVCTSAQSDQRLCCSLFR